MFSSSMASPTTPSAPWAGADPVQAGHGLVDHGDERRVRLGLRLAPEGPGGRVEGVGVLDVLTHRDLGELGHHGVGRRPADVGQGQGRLVGGDGQVLDGGRGLEDLDVGRAGGRGGRGQDADEGGAAGRTEQGAPAKLDASDGALRRVEGAVGRRRRRRPMPCADRRTRRARPCVGRSASACRSCDSSSNSESARGSPVM